MATADLVAGTGLLNCLVRELARSVDGGALLLPASGALMRVAPGRWPSAPELRTSGGWQPLDLSGLIAVAERELEARTGVRNTTLAAEIRDSREVVAALLTARATARPAEDLYLRSEQALLAGHRYHPAAKTRGGGPPDAWLPYAPEACASFPLRLLGVREDLLADEGETGALDALWGDRAPKGYRVLPAHPWQLELIGDHPIGRDGGLIDLGATAERAWATSSVRTVYLPVADLSLKFSLDVRITNDIRRLWLRDLRWLVAVDEVVAKAFADAPAGAVMLADSGYRTAGGVGEDAHEAYAVLVREGFGAGARPLLSAGLSEGFEGSPVAALGGAAQAVKWWRRYLERVVPPVLHAFFQHGVVLECHLQNVLVAMDADGMPSRAVFRDHEGVQLLAERHAELLAGVGTDVPTPGVDAGYGWERLVYCLVTNHLLEIAGAVAERCPAAADELWPQAREVFQRFTDHREVRDLLTAPSVPAKTNLLLRWTGADGGDSTYTPLTNPLRG